RLRPSSSTPREDARHATENRRFEKAWLSSTGRTWYWQPAARQFATLSERSACRRPDPASEGLKHPTWLPAIPPPPDCSRPGHTAAHKYRLPFESRFVLQGYLPSPPRRGSGPAQWPGTRSRSPFEPWDLRPNRGRGCPTTRRRLAALFRVR